MIGSKVSDNDVSELESVISKTIESNKKIQEVVLETGILQQHTNSYASDVDIVPLVETVYDDEKIEIASRKPAKTDIDENKSLDKIGLNVANENKSYVESTASTTESEIEIESDTIFEISTEMVTELSSSAMETKISFDSNTPVSTTETLQVRTLLHHHTFYFFFYVVCFNLKYLSFLR